MQPGILSVKFADLHADVFGVERMQTASPDWLSQFLSLLPANLVNEGGLMCAQQDSGTVPQRAPFALLADTYAPLRPPHLSGECLPLSYAA